MSAANKIIEVLKALGKAPTLEIVRASGLRWADALRALTLLEGEGVVRRVEILDYTKPLATAVWALQKPAAPETAEGEALGSIISLILNPPLLRDLGRALPASMGLLDSLDYIVSSASRSLKVSMPYIGELMSTLFTQHLQDLRRVSLLRVITEDEQGNRRALEPLKSYLPNLEVLYATRRVEGVKVLGVHLKMIIADEELAIVGTFNLTQAHLLVNYDIGFLLRGSVVRRLNEIFDVIWNKLAGEGGGQA